MFKNALIAALLATTLALAQTPKTRPEAGKLKVGDAVPNLSLHDLTGKKQIKLADLKGQPTVLIFGSCT